MYRALLFRIADKSDSFLITLVIRDDPRQWAFQDNTIIHKEYLRFLVDIKRYWGNFSRHTACYKRCAFGARNPAPVIWWKTKENRLRQRGILLLCVDKPVPMTVFPARHRRGDAGRSAQCDEIKNQVIGPGLWFHDIFRRWGGFPAGGISGIRENGGSLGTAETET